jgi:hypothetical protein
MNQSEIQKKAAELKKIMSEYKRGLSALEKELYRAISAYQKALEEERLKQIRSTLR